MLYTVSDLARTYEPSLRLIAGGGGLARTIANVGILDYELIPGLKNKYQRVNFTENMMVLSTFLYARDNPYLITEAIKYLVSKGASGLVIKNALHLAIPEQAIRYADVRNFPVFLTTSDSLFFDEIIYQVDRHIDELSERDYVQREVDAMLDERETERIERRARHLNPSFLSELAAVYIAFDEPLDPGQSLTAERCYRKSNLMSCRNLFGTYDGGLLFLASEDPERDIDTSAIQHGLDEILQAANITRRQTGCGISETGYGLDSLARAIVQARNACRYSEEHGGRPTSYADLGTLRALLPFAASPEMQSFEQEVMQPLREYDAEHTAQLEQTLAAFVDNGRRIDAAAEFLGQHPNTVRYRLEKVAQLTGLDYRMPDGLEQLSLACAIGHAIRLESDMR